MSFGDTGKAGSASRCWLPPVEEATEIGSAARGRLRSSLQTSRPTPCRARLPPARATLVPHSRSSDSCRKCRAVAGAGCNHDRTLSSGRTGPASSTPAGSPCPSRASSGRAPHTRPSPVVLAHYTVGRVPLPSTFVPGLVRLPCLLKLSFRVGPFLSTEPPCWPRVEEPAKSREATTSGTVIPRSPSFGRATRDLLHHLPASDPSPAVPRPFRSRAAGRPPAGSARLHAAGRPRSPPAPRRRPSVPGAP